MTTPMSAAEVVPLILSGDAPEGLTVRGTLDLSRQKGNLCLPAGLRCYELDLSETEITELPVTLQVEYRLNLSQCRYLRMLPAGLNVGSLILSGCTGLTTLPEGLEVNFLDISDCPNLTRFPQRGRIEFGRLRARHCTELTELPDWLETLAQLDVCGCTSLAELRDGLRVTSWIDVAQTQIRDLPPSLEGTQLRWRGVPVTPRIAFHPEQITGREILAEPNAELRRVMLERVGFERFFEEVEAEVLDTDTDAGGPRQLLRVPMEDDEALVCVMVRCPSTYRTYILRVPPNMQTCHQAVAWTAGFDNPDDYRPLVET